MEAVPNIPTSTLLIQDINCCEFQDPSVEWDDSWDYPSSSFDEDEPLEFPERPIQFEDQYINNLDQVLAQSSDIFYSDEEDEELFDNHQNFQPNYKNYMISYVKEMTDPQETEHQHKDDRTRAHPKCPGEPLPHTNKGYKLLKRNGWKDGAGLGKKEKGIKSPIGVRAQWDRTGLGGKVRSEIKSSLKTVPKFHGTKQSNQLLKYRTTSLLDDGFRGDTILVNLISCIATQPTGLSRRLAERYTYYTTVLRRRKLPGSEVAVPGDRPVPGSIHICEPKSPEEPWVADIAGQFNQGPALPNNKSTNAFIRKIKATIGPQSPQWETSKYIYNDPRNNKWADPHMLKGLTEDTISNRLKWFANGLKLIQETIVKKIINQVTFPYKMGDSQHEDWQQYLPIIE